MNYRRADDQLFGKYCYIDTPWIAGKKTIYRIVRSGVRSNAWCDVPVKFKDETVTHDHREDIVFAVLDTLIDENTKIKRFALKDVEIIEGTDRKTESNSEKPNNCEPQAIRCPKCGRTDYIRDMEKDMGIKGSHYKYKCINCNTYIKTEATISKMEQVEDEPQTDCSWR